WKKVAWAGEFARMFANVKSIRPPEGFGVLICRESLCGPVIRPICVSACHRMPGLTLPVTGSMVCAKILPDQGLVWEVLLKIWWSVCVMFGLEVADAAAAAVCALRLPSALERLVASAAAFSA